MFESSGCPDGWNCRYLGELCDIQIGGTPARIDPASWSSSDTGYPWVSIADLRSKWIVRTKERITDYGVKHSNAKLVAKGTPMMSFKLTIGRVGRAGMDLYTNEAIAAFLPRSLDVSASWLYHVLPLIAQGGIVDQAVKGQTLNKQKLQRLTACLPPPNEQCRIAEILDTVDDAIQQTEALIAKLKQVKAGLLHDLLTLGIDETETVREKGTNSGCFKQSCLGEIPESWSICHLQDLVASAVDGPFGSNLKTEHYVNSPGVRVVRLQNIGAGYFSDSDRAYISEAHALSLDRHRVVALDLLVASLGDDNHLIGRACLYPEGESPGIVKADCFRLRLQPNMADHNYVMHVLNCDWTREDLNILSQGVTRDRVNLTTLLKIRLRVPPLEEQRRIARVLNAHEGRIRTEAATLTKLESVKQGLMTDLLTGRVRTISSS